MDFNQQVIMLSMMTEKNSINNNIDSFFIIGFIIISIIFVIWLLIALKEK